MIRLHLTDRCGLQPARTVHSINWRSDVPCTARDLIAKRAAREFEALSTPVTPVSLQGHLVQYSRHATSTVQDAVRLAVQGFAIEAFFLVVDGHHIKTLDEPVSLSEDSTVTFVRMLPKLAA